MLLIFQLVLELNKGETLIDTVKIFFNESRYCCDETSISGAHQFLSRHIEARITNAGDGTHEHPTKALLDCYSIKEKLGF